MDRDELSGIEPGELRLKTLRVDPVRSADVLRLEAPRLARREVSQDDERSDRRDFRDGPLVAHDIALLEGRQADEGRDPVELAALPADLEDSLVIPSALLLARVAVRGLDANPDLEILDRGQLLEPARCLDPDGEVVRVLLPRDVREAQPLIGSKGRHRLPEEL